VILTVTLNAALDLTYRVDKLSRGASHRVRSVAERAGGKGVNVARVLSALGEPVVATGLAGGGTGARLRALLGDEGVVDEFEPIGAESRRTVAVVDDDHATGFWEPGPEVTRDEWEAFRSRYRALLADARAVVLSGSLPSGLPPDAYAALIGAARRAGVACVLDADGEPLRLGLAAGPDLIKPNAEELARLCPEPAPADPTRPAATDPSAAGPAGASSVPGQRSAAGRSADRIGTGPPPAALGAARAARALGAGAVVASLGPDGLLAVTERGEWWATPPVALRGNPTGAGDACVAALARGLAGAVPWPRRLVDAVALSAAAVLAPVAGQVDLADFDRLRPEVGLAELGQAGSGGRPAAVRRLTDGDA
jgi:tagatose 6-phosphate kinase